MAPIAVDSIDTFSWSLVLSIIVTLAVSISLVFTVLLCCCGAGGASQDDHEDDATVFFSTDPDSPDYCEDCARKAMGDFAPSIYAGGYSGDVGGQRAYPRRSRRSKPHRRTSGHDRRRRTRSRSGTNKRRRRATAAAGRTHRFDHGHSPGQVFKSGGPATAHTARSFDEQAKPALAPRGGTSQGPRGQHPKSPAKPASSAGGVFVKSAADYGRVTKALDCRRPVPATDAPCAHLYPRRSLPAISNRNPFQEKMRAAQADPAYRTIWGAKSGVFDKANGVGARGEGQTMAREPAARPVAHTPQATMTDDARMKAAQANPAYKTLWDAKSGVFDQKPVGQAGAVPAASDYRG